MSHTSIAYRGDLAGALVPGREVPPPRFAETTPRSRVLSSSAPIAPLETRGRVLRRRADEALDRLAATVAGAADLPDPARADLDATVRKLRQHAEGLALEVDRLGGAVGAGGAAGMEVASMRARRDRLQTLERAGEPIDTRALARLEASIGAHEADLVAEEQVEARLSACCAELLEIASTASRVRRELVAAPSERLSADEAVRRLREEAKLADQARREAGLRATLTRIAR